MSNYTPGPWFIDDTGDLKGAAGAPIYFQGGNARLIAAAPELLEACCAAESLLCEVWDAVSPLVSGGPDQVNNVADKLHAAIAKATQG